MSMHPNQQNTKRIHVPNMGPDDRAIPVAIAVGVDQCKKLGLKTLTLITPAKDNLDSIIIGEFLGKEVCKKLMKGQTVAVGETGISVKHESVATALKTGDAGVGLAFYVSSDAIQKLDGKGFKCLIFVPWLDTDGTDWAAKWNAATHGGQTVGAEVRLPPEVIAALQALSAIVNLSTGLSHPSDKGHAKRKFTELQSNGIKWAAPEVEKWAARNGWKPADAQELAALSADFT